MADAAIMKGSKMGPFSVAQKVNSSNPSAGQDISLKTYLTISLPSLICMRGGDVISFNTYVISLANILNYNVMNKPGVKV